MNPNRAYLPMIIEGNHPSSYNSENKTLLKCQPFVLLSFPGLQICCLLPWSPSPARRPAPTWILTQADSEPGAQAWGEVGCFLPSHQAPGACILRISSALLPKHRKPRSEAAGGPPQQPRNSAQLQRGTRKILT